MVSFEWETSKHNQKIMKTGNLSQLCDCTMRVSVDKYFFSVNKCIENIVKIIVRIITINEFKLKLQECYYYCFW